MKNKLVISAVLYAVIMPAFAFEFRNSVIYHAADAPPSVVKAAQELQYHLQLVIGKKLEIVKTPRSPMIALGDSPASQKAGIDVSKYPYEQYRILTRGNDLFIVGKDLPGDAPTKYGSPAIGRSFGTLYGVYDFLEHQLGISWLLPGPQGIWHPEPNPDLKIKDIDIIYKPQFLMRCMVGGMSNPYPPLREWCMRNRYANRFSAGSLDWGADHSWYILYPDQNNSSAVAKKVKSRQEAFAEHPEYFGMTADGKRIPPTGQFSLCITNPAVWRDVAERVRTFTACSKRNYYFISPNDATPTCACPKCQSQLEDLSERKIGPTGGNFVRMSWTKPVMRYYREVCNILPGIYLRGLIYQKYEFVPADGILKMPDNFIADMAPVQTGYGPVRLYEPVNKTWKNWEKSWRGIFKQQIYSSVEFWLRQYAGAPMSPYPGIFKDTFDAINANPAYIAFYVYMNMGFGHSACYNWMMMQMLWNPKQDPYQLMDIFLTKAYGGAAPHLKAFYALAEKNMRNFYTVRKGKYGYNISPELINEVYAADWNQFEKIYFSALKAPMNENQKWRLKMFGKNLQILRYHLVQYGFIKDDESPLRLNDEQFKILTKRRSPGGDLYLLLDPPYTTSHMKRASVRFASVNPVPSSQISNPDEKWNSSFYMGHQDIIVYASRNGFAEFQLNFETGLNRLFQKPYLPDIPYFTVLDQTRKFYFHGIAQKGKISFPVRKGQYYYLFYSPLGDYAAGCRWQLVSANMPFAFGPQIDDAIGVRFYRMKSPIYFLIRKDIPKMRIHFNGWFLNAEVVSPDGKIVANPEEKNDNLRHYTFVDVINPAKGWWKIRNKDSRGFSGIIRCDSALDGYFVLNPALALDVQVASPRSASDNIQSQFRVDISAVTKGKEACLTSPAAPAVTIPLKSPDWIKTADRNRRLYGSCVVNNREEWKDFSFNVMADRDTQIYVSLGGQWASKAENMPWVSITGIKVNGITVPNGDFLISDKNGSPAGFNLGSKARFVSAADKKQKNFVTVRCKDPLSKTFQIKGNRIYTFSVLVRAAFLPEIENRKSSQVK